MEKKTIKQVGFFGGKFLYSPTGWPENPLVRVGARTLGELDEIHEDFKGYQQSLSSAIAQAVEFEDQERISMIVSDYAIFNHRLFDKDSEGVYTIPPTEIVVVEVFSHCTRDEKHYTKVARLVTQENKKVTKWDKLDEILSSTSDDEIREWFAKRKQSEPSPVDLGTYDIPQDHNKSATYTSAPNSYAAPVEETQEELAGGIAEEIIYHVIAISKEPEVSFDNQNERFLKQKSKVKELLKRFTLTRKK